MLSISSVELVWTGIQEELCSNCLVKCEGVGEIRGVVVTSVLCLVDLGKDSKSKLAPGQCWGFERLLSFRFKPFLAVIPDFAASVVLMASSRSDLCLSPGQFYSPV